MFHYVRYLFFPPKLKNCLFSSILTKIHRIWRTGLKWQIIWWYPAVEMSSGQNSVVLKFVERVCWGTKIAKIVPFWANWCKIQNCILQPKISFLGQLGWGVTSVWAGWARPTSTFIWPSSGPPKSPKKKMKKLLYLLKKILSKRAFWVTQKNRFKTNVWHFSRILFPLPPL